MDSFATGFTEDEEEDEEDKEEEEDEEGTGCFSGCFSGCFEEWGATMGALGGSGVFVGFDEKAFELIADGSRAGGGVEDRSVGLSACSPRSFLSRFSVS